MRNNEFKNLISEICRYYNIRGLTMEPLAEKIGITKRMLQLWKSEGKRPHDSSLQLLYQFLKENNGGQFIIELKRALEGSIIKEAVIERGQFPDNLAEEDKETIRKNFPGNQSLKFLCAMIVYDNKSLAAEETLPGGSLAQKAALISGYEASMKKAKKVFGIDGTYDWKDKVIQYIGQLPEEDGDIESLGQEAVNNIIEGYFSQK